MGVDNYSARAFLRLGLAAGVLSMGAACDYNGDFLFADVGDVPSIRHIDGDDEGYVTPVVVENLDQVRSQTIYAEVGAPSSAAPGGVTLNFKGTGGDVCVWVDPEMAFWNEKVGFGSSPQGNPWEYPDNTFDDGDLDLFVGLSVYYTGSPGEEMGDFFVAHEDSLGNEVPIELVACSSLDYYGDLGAHAGRGTAEYCTVKNTDAGISYTIALHTFSTPLDDDRLGFGLIVADGTCEALKTAAGASGLAADECVIQGEGIIPTDGASEPWIGFDPDRAWAGSVEFESAFCATEVVDFCEAELEAVQDADTRCSWDDAAVEGGARCFCGDPT